MQQLVTENEIDLDSSIIEQKNKFDSKQRQNDSILEIDPLDDFLQHVKEDIDVNNISGLFKIDLMDEQVRTSIDKEAKNYVSGTL